MEILNQDLSFNITKPDGSIETLFVPYNENNVLISEQDVKNLIGDARKARVKLGWKSKTDINTLIKEMMQEDFKTISKLL